MYLHECRLHVHLLVESTKQDLSLETLTAQTIWNQIPFNPFGTTRQLLDVRKNPINPSLSLLSTPF